MLNIFNIFKKKNASCDKNENCPIYLAYLGKYDENSDEIKSCKNPKIKYCKKYNITEPTDWKNLSKVEKMKIIRDMNLLNFIEKKIINY